MPGFAAAVDEWVANSKQAMLAVRNESAQRIFEIAQTPIAKGGNMPVKTGFLRASGRATKDGSIPLSISRDGPAEDDSFQYDEGAVLLVISSAKLTDTITFAYTANYAKFVEAKRKFTALAAQKWQQTVDEVVGEVKARYGT